MAYFAVNRNCAEWEKIEKKHFHLLSYIYISQICKYAEVYIIFWLILKFIKYKTKNIISMYYELVEYWYA